MLQGSYYFNIISIYVNIMLSSLISITEYYISLILVLQYILISKYYVNFVKKILYLN